MIPTSIDGTDITGATIDGTDVTEITVDGDSVFTAGPGDPPDLTNLDLHYAARLETAYANNDIVTTFNDQNGSFNAPIAGGDPTFRTNQINGLPVVEYDGNDAHDSGHVQNTNDDHSFYAVINPTTVNQGTTLFFGRFDGSTRNSRGFQNGGEMEINYGNSVFASGNTGDVPSSPSVFTAIYDGGIATGFVDGNQKLNQGTYSGAPSSTSDFIGARNFSGLSTTFDGQIAEILTYNVAHSTATRQSVENFLQSIYNI